MAMTNQPYHRLFSDWRLDFLMAIVLVGGAGLLHGWRDARIARLNVEPIDLPLPAQAGSVGPRRFQIGYAGGYDVEVIVSGFSNSRAKVAAECRLGVSLSPEAECVNTPPVVDLRWRLEQLGPRTQQAESVVRADVGSASGQAHGGGFSPDLLSRRLTGFRGQVGDIYSVSVESRSELAAIEQFQPRIRIGPNMITREELALNLMWFDIGVWLARGAAAGLAILACSLLAASWVRGRREPKAG